MRLQWLFQSPTQRKFLIATLAITAFLYSSYLFAADAQSQSKLPRYRVFSLKHISARQGIDYLANVKIGTVSQLPSPNTLLVTASPRELIKTSAILKLVDSNQPFVIQPVFPASQADNLPSNESIAAEVGDILIGTFAEPPDGTPTAKAIIDIHGDDVIAIAPAGKLEKIISAIELLQRKDIEAQTSQPSEPRKSTKPNQMTQTEIEPGTESELLKTTGTSQPQQVVTDVNEQQEDEFFGKLLDSLAEAEKVATELEAVEQPTSPVEPDASTEQTEEAVAEQPTVREEVEAVVEIPEARGAGEEPKPQPELTAEEVMDESEQPQEAAKPIVTRSYKPEAVELAEETLELDLPETLPIIELLDLVGKYLQLDYMYNQAELKDKQVSLKIQGPIKVKELYPLLESALKFQGFVMTRKGNLITVVPADRVLDIDPTLLDAKKGKVQYGDVIVTRVFELAYTDTTSAKNLLDAMKLGVNINPIEATGTLVVIGYAYRMPRIEQLLEMIDRPGEPKQFRFRQLKYTMATSLAPKIKTLVEQLGEISITVAKAAKAAATPKDRRRVPKKPTPAAESKGPTRPTVHLDSDERTNRILMIGLKSQLDVVEGLIDTLDVQQQDLRNLRLYEIQHVGAEEVMEKLEQLGIISGGAQAKRPSARAKRQAKSPEPAPLAATAEPLAEEPQVVLIESSNSLLVNATPEQHGMIATIIGYVDAEQLEAAIPYVVYSLENQDPGELAGILNQLVLETVESKGAEDSKITRTTKKLEEDITIIPDPETYSLVVYASRKNQQWISSLIKNLDEYRPQVLLDVTLVEVSKNDEFNYDLNLIESFPDLLTTSGLTGTIIPGLTAQDIAKKLNEDAHRNRFIDLQSNSGSATAFYGDKHVNLLLTAIQTKGYGRVLARPKILVDDNKEGTIKTEEKTYRTRTETTVQTTSGEPITTSNVIFDPFDSGITLTIKPHISKGDQLRLEITLERSDFRDTAASLRDKDPTPPDKITSNVDTVITVPDGRTIILGGLEKVTQSKGGSKVPLLGDIPLIGGLFRSVANSDAQTRLYVFVKAHILRPGEKVTGKSDVEIVSAKNRATFEKYEQEMQEYEDWPGIKPKPMDPLKILEAD